MKAVWTKSRPAWRRVGDLRSTGTLYQQRLKSLTTLAIRSSRSPEPQFSPEGVRGFADTASGAQPTNSNTSSSFKPESPHKINVGHLDLPSLDSKWQSFWAAEAAEEPPAPLEKEKSMEKMAEESRRRSDVYILPMFPYPSGNLHMGHMRVYTIADVLSRWTRMRGYRVLNPMGWDAFGLPAENAAIERGVEPAAWTRDNIEKMRSLLKEMNTGLDWSKEFATCDPEFYKHTQKLFLMMLERGLAYQAEGMVNWDPVDKTVLANEQVDKDGFSWRSGAKVEPRSLKQWYLKVTEFKQALLDDLRLLARDEQWPERVISQQRNWIGRSNGVKFKFMVGTADGNPLAFKPVQVFTTRADTLLGVQFLAVSGSHPIVQEKLPHDPELAAFVEGMKGLPADSKAGFRLKNTLAVNPAITLTKTPDALVASVPVFVAPYVLEGYGEGAVMGVPGHDERDHAFWKLNAPTEAILKVIGSDHLNPPDETQGAYTASGKLLPICGKFAGLTSSKAAHQLASQLEKKRLAEESETWRLRDWLISRQRYWGTPIPIIHCDSCGAVPVPDGDLPVILPKLHGGYFKGKTGNPLESATEWVNTPCPKCKGPGKRDTDTMDTFMDSSWYFMRFPDAHNKQELFSKQNANKFLPVDVYVGGVEHAILHLLYSRFVSKFLASIGMWPMGNRLSVRGEPFKKLITQGMVHGKTYSDPNTGRFLRPDELDMSSPTEPRMLSTGELPSVSYEKMSKSKHNGVDPTSLMRQYGSDVVRAHTLFSAPVTDILNWDDEKIVGVSRWLQRVSKHVEKVSARLAATSETFAPGVDRFNHSKLITSDQMSLAALQDLLDSIEQSFESTSLNTLVSDLMKMSAALHSTPVDSNAVEYLRTSTLLRAMAPVVPAFTEECWQSLHCDGGEAGKSIFDQPFPRADRSITTILQSVNCTVQQNGKVRFSTKIPRPPDDVEYIDEWIITELKATDAGRRWYEEKGSVWKRIVVVHKGKLGKLVNFVG